MIHDVAHVHDDTTQGIIAVVASNMTLYTTYMSKSETPAAFCRTFQANVATINTHGGSAGCHPQLFNDHVARLMSERGLDDECDKHGADYKKVMLDAERGSCDKYLACLFTLVVNGGRYQGLKQALDNQYLMDTLYTTYMSKSETPAAFCRTFQANVATINTHGGSAGRHPKLFNDHVARLMSERGLDDECDKHGADYKKVMVDA